MSPSMKSSTFRTNHERSPEYRSTVGRAWRRNLGRWQGTRVSRTGRDSPPDTCSAAGKSSTSRIPASPGTTPRIASCSRATRDSSPLWICHGQEHAANRMSTVSTQRGQECEMQFAAAESLQPAKSTLSCCMIRRQPASWPVCANSVRTSCGVAAVLTNQSEPEERRMLPDGACAGRLGSFRWDVRCVASSAGNPSIP
jgi:hypothetical protein